VTSPNASATPRALGAPPGKTIDLEQLRPILPQLIDSLSDAVVVVDRAQRVVAANRRYLEAFGLNRADLVGSACKDVLHCPEVTSGPGPNRCAACDVIEQRRPQRRLRSLPDATGAQRRWEASFNPILDPGGEVSHIVEVWRDITDRSELESQLSHGERLASLGMLAAGVAHEINNPLASVMAGIESLSRWMKRCRLEAAAAAEAAEVLAVIEQEITRCRETTDKLMLLAQPYSVAPSWVRLNQAARDTVSLLRFQMRKQGVEVVEELDPDLPEIWAKETGMRAVCMNLMMNAVHAMPAGGTLRVVTAGRESSVALTVEDTGPGIAPQHLDRIWDPFFTTKPMGQGTGLGLSITQRIVSRHGGTIRVENLPGRGARFVVELPIRGSGGPDA
jgi:hypothetical protein